MAETRLSVQCKKCDSDLNIEMRGDVILVAPCENCEVDKIDMHVEGSELIISHD